MASTSEKSTGSDRELSKCGKFLIVKVPDNFNCDDYEALDDSNFFRFVIRFDETGMEWPCRHSRAGPIKDLFAMELVNEGIDPDEVTLTYRGAVVKSGDTPESLVMKEGDVISGKRTVLAHILFVGGESLGGTVPVKVDPEQWSTIKMKEVFNSYVKKQDIQLKSLKFTSEGERLFLSSIGKKTPESLGLGNKSEIHVSKLNSGEDSSVTESSAAVTATITKANGQTKKSGKGSRNGKNKSKKKIGPKQQPYAWMEEWSYLLGKEEQCSHGCDALKAGRNVSNFVNVLFDAQHSFHARGEHLEGLHDAFHTALRETYNSHKEVWLYEKLRHAAIQKLIMMGTNAVLAEKDSLNIALAIVHLENFCPQKLKFGLMWSETLIKLQKLEDGGEREKIRFFYKRTQASCNCLKDMYKQVKAMKTGVCAHCKEIKDSSLMTMCSRCELVDYCSKQCQEMAWTEHKGVCKMVSEGKVVISWCGRPANVTSIIR